MPRELSPRPDSFTVLQAIKAPGADTTYATHMLASASPEVEIRFFTWRTALSGTYDVLHLHWPEYLIRGRGKVDAAKALWRIPRLIWKVRRDRIAVVRTLHNPNPHEHGYWFEHALLKWLDRQVVRYIALNPATDAPMRPAEVILHGDYIAQFAPHPRTTQMEGQLLYFGLVRPYKGIDRLLAAFQEIDSNHLSLRIVGRPNSPTMHDLIAQEVAKDPERVSARLEFVSDADLVSEVTSSELVILPYREMHNSGSLLVALSLGRPVLTPDTPVNRTIADEIGPGWLWLYTGELTEHKLRETLKAVREGAAERPDYPVFQQRDWETVGRRHRQLYLEALCEARNG